MKRARFRASLGVLLVLSCFALPAPGAAATAPNEGWMSNWWHLIGETFGAPPLEALFGDSEANESVPDLDPNGFRAPGEGGDGFIVLDPSEPGTSADGSDSVPNLDPNG